MTRVLLAMCAAITSAAAPSMHQDATTSATASPDVRRYSLSLQRVSISDVVKSIHKDWRINVITDVYSDEVVSPSIEVKDEPLHVALARIGAAYDRDVFVNNGTVVLRHRKWFLRSAQEAENAKNYGMRWTNAGIIKITQSAANSLRGNGQATSPNEASPRDKPPVRSDARTGPVPVEIHVREAPIESVLANLSSAVKWTASVSNELRSKRLTIETGLVTPGHVFENITLLFGARQEVRIGFSKEQIEAQAALAADALDQRTDLEKKSDEFAKKLFGMLTADQKAAYARGEDVSIPAGSMSGALLTAAQDYAMASFGEINGETVGGLTLDMSRAKEFSFRLSRNNLIVGVAGFLSDGTRIEF